MILENLLLEDLNYPESSDEYFLFQALKQSIVGLPTSSPNPSVGCIIVNPKGELIAMGSHKLTGEPHAEIEALAQIATVKLSEDHFSWSFEKKHFEQVDKATVFVTLEPCAHKGLTPSCAESLSRLPIKRVVSILSDPNPLVAGQGFEILKSHGIEVVCWEFLYGNSHPLVKQAKRIHRFFLHNIEKKRPFFSLKIAQSLDGFIGLKNGESQWITSDLARNAVRYLRAIHDGLMTGKGTILGDNPRLDLRETPYSNKRFPLFVWDSNLELLRRSDLNVFKVRSPKDVTLISQKKDLKKGFYLGYGKDLSDTHEDLKEVRILYIPKDPTEAKSSLYEFLKQDKIQSIWIEAGAQLSSFMINHDLIDQVFLFIGNQVIGNANGLSWTSDVLTSRLKDSKKLSYEVIKPLGSDIFLLSTFP